VVPGSPITQPPRKSSLPNTLGFGCAAGRRAVAGAQSAERSRHDNDEIVGEGTMLTKVPNERDISSQTDQRNSLCVKVRKNKKKNKREGERGVSTRNVCRRHGIAPGCLPSTPRIALTHIVGLPPLLQISPNRAVSIKRAQVAHLTGTSGWSLQASTLQVGIRGIVWVDFVRPSLGRAGGQAPSQSVIPLEDLRIISASCGKRRIGGRGQNKYLRCDLTYP